MYEENIFFLLFNILFIVNEFMINWVMDLLVIKLILISKRGIVYVE